MTVLRSAIEQDNPIEDNYKHPEKKSVIFKIIRGKRLTCIALSIVYYGDEVRQPSQEVPMRVIPALFVVHRSLETYEC